MKKIEKPFAESAVSRLTRAETAYELAHKRYCDLKFLRDKIASGHLTPELYNFINTDKSLENLFLGLPRPTDVACEALSASQLAILDATIADEALHMKEIMIKIWEAIKDWLMDWWDRNRWEKRNLDYLLGTWHNNPGAFGDGTTFAATNVMMYSYTDWYKMLNACRKLNQVCRTLASATSESMKDSVEKAKVPASEPLKEFGKYIDEGGIIRQGVPNYTRRENTCANLRWKLFEVSSYINDAKSIMEEDIDIRRQFNELERKFKNADPTDRASVMFAKRLIFSSKENSLHIGRTLRIMLNKIIRDHGSMYRMNVN